MRKKHGKSGGRNGIQGLRGEAFRHTCAQLKRPCAVVLIPKPCEEHTLRAFESSLRGALKREGLL